MKLNKDDSVKACPYSPRLLVECRLIRREYNYWIAKDVEIPKKEKESMKCYGDMSIIKLTDDMIQYVWRMSQLGML